MKTTSIKDILGDDLYAEYLQTMSMSAEVDMCQISFDEVPACPLEGCHLTIPDNIEPIIDRSLLDVVDSAMSDIKKSSSVDFDVDDCLRSIDSVCEISRSVVEEQKTKIKTLRDLSEKIPEMFMTFMVFDKNFRDMSSEKSLKDGIPREIYEVFRIAEKSKSQKFEKIEKFTESLDFSNIESFKKSLFGKLLILRNVVQDNGKPNIDIVKRQYGDWKRFMKRIHSRKTIEKHIVDFCNACVILDTSETEKLIISRMSSVKCVASNISKISSNEPIETAVDLKFMEISKNPETYDMTKPQYWKKFTKFLNLVALFPQYWATGIILPPSTPIKLPIIHKFLVVIPVMIVGKIFVVWLTINGIVIFPVVLEIGFQGSVSSIWKTLFRGAQITIKQGGGSLVTNVNLKTETSNGGSSVVDSSPEKFSQNAMTSDDYPPFERMDLGNGNFLTFLNLLMQKQVPYQGFPM